MGVGRDGYSAGVGLRETRISLVRFALFTGAAAVLLIAVVAWVLGSTLVEPQNHAVPLPAGFDAQIVSIPGSDHAIAGWWVDRGVESPGQRCGRSSSEGVGA